MTNKGSIAGKVAIVTGAGRGLGRAMAVGLARAGVNVIATAARQGDEIEDVAAAGASPPRGGQIVPVVADVTKEVAAERTVGVALERFGRLDIMVNTAGLGMKYVSAHFMTEPPRFWEVDPATWRMVIDTNVTGPFLMARAAVPHLLRPDGGRLVNISMNHATMRRPGFSPYGPSKAALESETVIWAGDLVATGITVNALLPGGATATGKNRAERGTHIINMGSAPR